MLLLAAASLTVSCSREKSGFGLDEPTDIQGDAIAYLDLAGGLSVTVHKSPEGVNVYEGDSAASTSTKSTRTITRTANTDVDDYQVEIIAEKDNSVVASGTYGSFKNAEKPLALTVGRYKIRAYSAEMKEVAWESDENQPTYGAESNFFELKMENTEDNPYTPEALNCTLQSIQVSVALEEELAVLCSNTSVEVKIEDETEKDRKVTFNDNEAEGKEDYVFGVVDLTEEDNGDFTVSETQRVSKNAFLAPVHEENELVANFHATIDGNVIEKRVHITSDAKAGQWHKVSLYLKSGPADNTGSIVIGAAIETWLYNELVEVKSLSTDFDEEVIPDIDDANAPRIIPRDGCFLVSDTNHITASHYTNMGDYNKTALIDINTTSKITRFAVRILTDNPQFSNELKARGLNKTIDLLSTDPSEMSARNSLHSLGFPRGVAIEDGGSQHTVDLSGFMTFLAPYSGWHEITIAVTDQNGFYSRIDIDLNIDLQNGTSTQPADGRPTIVWEGNDIDTRQEVYDGLPCQIRIEAKEGIAEFIVDISGTIAGLLSDVDIPAHFSLITPEDSQIGEDVDLANVLHNFGFPVGNDVKGKNIINFDISNFMQLIKGSCPTGDVDFRLTVTDSKGNTESKAIMLHTVLEE